LFPEIKGGWKQAAATSNKKNVARHRLRRNHENRQFGAFYETSNFEMDLSMKRLKDFF